MGIVLSYVFHAFGWSGSGLGQIFLPLHVPVLLCGLICGWKAGLSVGAIVPLLSVLLVGRPPLYPIGLVMMFELAAYGTISGILKKQNVFAALIAAMLGGRAVFGIATAVFTGFGENGFAIKTFLTSAFVTAFPGIIIQIVLIPAVMIALNKSKVIT